MKSIEERAKESVTWDCDNEEFDISVAQYIKGATDFADVGKIALTWQDVKRIVEIADDTIRKACYEHMSEEEYYTEVLRKFKEQ